jgi:hypothetical protein
MRKGGNEQTMVFMFLYLQQRLTRTSSELSLVIISIAHQNKMYIKLLNFFYLKYFSN